MAQTPNAEQHMALAQLAVLGGPTAWRAIREQAKRPRSDLAKEIGTTRQSPWDWETGRRTPSPALAPHYLAVLLRLREESGP